MDDIVLYTVKDIKRIFSCGTNVAYALMNSYKFPSFRINKKLYVHKDRLEKWLDQNKSNDLIVKY